MRLSPRDYIDLRLAERDRALELQAKEYERRLADLNHAHEQALRVQHTYVTADKFDALKTSEALARELAAQQVFDRLTELENFKARATGAALVLTLFAATAGAAIARSFD